MKQVFYVRDIVKEKDSDDLVSVSMDVDYYCSNIIHKIFNIINRVEELTDSKISDDDILRSNCFDAIGLAKRLPKNIYIDGDGNEKL
jgi:hypothetical protein